MSGSGCSSRRATGKPAIRRWWNGYSAILDTTNPHAVSWLHDVLDSLRTRFGIDGFKFDGGDVRHYRTDDVTAAGASPTGQCEAWAAVGIRYAFNEYRACWKHAGAPLAQRLHDKPAGWGPGGLASLIPEAIAQGLIGHPFVCPDMVGGGELDDFPADVSDIDQELFVRYAQCAALFPMLQFSAAPRRVLDDEHLTAVREVVALRQQLVPQILDLVREAARTGEPVLRPLAYHWDGYDDVDDQFLLGDRILVAPVLTPGATLRKVLLPRGHWVSADGTEHRGQGDLDIRVGLRSLPWFRRTDASGSTPGSSGAAITR